jgi:uncharacterized Zn finger protein (UPF0148 family)
MHSVGLFAENAEVAFDSVPLQAIEKDGAFACSVCDRRFLNKSSCVRHFATHLGKTTCSVCHKSFGHVDALKQHFAVHLGTTTCPVCNRKFGREFYLKVHLEKMHQIFQI